jgi:hypothetical protein
MTLSVADNLTRCFSKFGPKVGKNVGFRNNNWKTTNREESWSKLINVKELPSKNGTAST